jgi:hypothetical protein
MNWPFRRRETQPAPRLPHARPITDSAIAATTEPGDFACASCGRTDLEPAGDWDPPLCADCDAALDFETVELEMRENDGKR